MWSRKYSYNVLQITDVKLTGIFGTFLIIGIMFAYFNYKGTVPSFTDMLNTCASDDILICSTIVSVV